ncbi:MAG: PD-(D/E)XK nuclease family protein [Bacilli bacterium]|nr:PD-(D/E)XK nuclease family protein [Bacilli bacterium]
MQRIVVCPNEEKLRILADYESDKNLHNIKFMTKEEFISNYYFSYDENAIYYLMKKYNYNIDVCKVYLNNLYIIDLDREYNNSKLNFLKSLKKELIDNKLLYFSHTFKKGLINKEIEVRNYYDLDKYEEEALNYSFCIPEIKFGHDVYEFKTIEEEVNFVCLEIIKLINKGIDINKIYLTNVSEDYLYVLKKIFSYYKIPININFRESIFSTNIVKDYLEKDILDLEDERKKTINRKLVNVLNSLSFLAKDDIYKKILIDKLKSTSISYSNLNNAVNIKDFYKESFRDDEYVFVLGFNQDLLPHVYQDINYISDDIKDEVALYKTDYLNKREKQTIIYLLSKIKNLSLSYKLSTPFNKYYKSSLIEEYDFNIISDYKFNYNYSNIYNKIKLVEMLDKYNLYGEKDSDLNLLNSNYTIPYLTYDNSFTGIDNDLYLKNLPYPLKLSYTSLNSYNECKFKYYLKYVLKLDKYEDTFAAFIGSLYHEILSLWQKYNFNFEEEYNKYLERRELNLKEKLLLIRIKRELLSLIEILKEQSKYTKYDEALYEAYAEVDLEKSVSVKFVGYIDKIMYSKVVEDTYFSIIDYKTGLIDTHIEPMKYGLHMQLPVYLYLIHYSKLFTNPIFTGIYYQNILFNYLSWSLKLDKDLKDRYLLNGYSTDNTDVLEKFDITYKDSNLIKGMKYSPDKGFGTYSKIIDDSTLYNLVKYTKKHISDRVDEILEGDFKINPKVYVLDNVSCTYCKFNDICFMRKSQLEYLDKVDDLSFLGGE